METKIDIAKLNDLIDNNQEYQICIDVHITCKNHDLTGEFYQYMKGYAENLLLIMLNECKIEGK